MLLDPLELTAIKRTQVWEAGRAWSPLCFCTIADTNEKFMLKDGRWRMSAARRREGGREEGVAATLQWLWDGEGRASTVVCGDGGAHT